MPELVYWQWIAIGLAFLILEMLVPGAILMWFGVGALALRVLLLVGVPLSLPLQLLIFAVLSLAGVLIGRRYEKWGNETGDKPNLSRRADGYIGQVYVLVRAIENGRGTIRLGDTDWRVKGDDLPNGSKVRVTGVDGATLIVEDAKLQSEQTNVVAPEEGAPKE